MSETRFRCLQDLQVFAEANGLVMPDQLLAEQALAKQQAEAAAQTPRMLYEIEQAMAKRLPASLKRLQQARKSN